MSLHFKYTRINANSKGTFSQVPYNLLLDINFNNIIAYD